MAKKAQSNNQKVTIKDIARLAKVSVGTVSNYLNGTAHVAEDTRQQIETVINQLNYHPNMNARSLRSKRTQSLGLLVPNISNPFFSEIARLIERYAWEAGYQIFLCDSDGDKEREEAHLETLYQRRVDGVIIIHTGNKSLRRLVENWSIPTIFVDRHLKGLPSIVSDNELGGKLSLEHLLSLGHVRVAIMAGDAHVDNVQERLKGAYDVLDQHGIEVPGDYRIEGTQSLETGIEAHRFWDLPEYPTAVFTTNDVIALGVWHSCLARGLRIPEDVSLIGFDNIQWSALTVPPLTTVAQDIEAICNGAVTALDKAINEQASLGSDTQLIQPQLLIRGSTTYAPSHQQITIK